MNEPDPWASAYVNAELPRPPNPHLVATLSRLDLKPGGRALDLGCGSGRHLPLLPKRGLRPFGFDLSEAALAKARRFTPNVPLARASAEHIPFRDGAFDLMVVWGVLFHLRPDRLIDALREIRRVVSRDGIAILHALDPSDWRRDPNAGPEHRRAVASPHRPGVIDTFYTPEEIAGMLSPLFTIVSREMVHTRHDYGLSAEWVIVVQPQRHAKEH